MNNDVLLILAGIVGVVLAAFSTKAQGSTVSASTVVSGRRSTSYAGIQAIKSHETFVPHVYMDPTGHPTIGYGHLIKPGESFTTITRAQGEQLLTKDLGIAENAVNGFVKVPLSQGQFDALVSLVFNIGTGAFQGSTLLRRLNAGDYQAAADQFHVWRLSNGVILPGLVSRRASESRMFVAATNPGDLHA